MPHPITKPCGTYAAAARHTRRGEPLCDPCVEARRAWWRDRAAIAWSIPAWRARETARTAERMRVRRLDPEYRAVANTRRRQLHAAARAAARLAVDEVAVERACAGDPPSPLRRVDRLEAVRRMHARGRSYTSIAAGLRVDSRQVHRDLAGLGLIRQDGAA